MDLNYYVLTDLESIYLNSLYVGHKKDNVKTRLRFLVGQPNDTNFDSPSPLRPLYPQNMKNEKYQGFFLGPHK
jgi:hypothetical protein